MRDEPNAMDLLEIALKTFNENILPEVSPEQRYSALMIANALSIAARELNEGEEQGRMILKALQTLFGEKETCGIEGIALYEEIEDLERQLCDDIARGKYDTDFKPLMTCLKTVVHARLAISNPKLLAAGA